MAAFDGTTESDSALRLRFAAAKKSMETIYENDMNFVQSMLDIIADEYFPRRCFTSSELKLKELKDKINRICSIIRRGKMKAVFFGKTSSGKSALINALLRHNVLPSTFGETTAAFVTVEGTDLQEEHAEINYDTFQEPITMEEFRQRCNFLDIDVENSKEMTVYWPKEKSELLRNELVIIDCPGTSTKSDTDKKVTEYCEDADIHIFVVNSVNTLNEAAEEFFKAVARSISKPNVLIVFTWWDQAQSIMGEDDQKRVHGQHKDRATELLKLTLRVVETHEQAQERIFFTSPVEILKKKEDLLPKWQERKNNFLRFEDTFKAIVSTSAIETKFKGHYEEGLLIVKNAHSHLNDMEAELDKSKREKEDRLRELKREIQTFSQKRGNFDKESELFVNLSVTRIVDKKTKKEVEAAKQDIKRRVKYDVRDLDENDATVFGKKLTDVACKRTEEMEMTLKSITEREQDMIKSQLEESFKKLFPDFNLIRNADGGYQHAEMNFSNAAKVSGEDFSVGFFNQISGGARKVLSSKPFTLAAKCGPVLTGAKAVVSGGMWYYGAAFWAITAPAVAVAAAVVGGATAVGYGVKQGLDWNKQRLEDNLREQCADNSARFMESKLDEFQEKCSGVMRRYSDITRGPYLDVLNREESAQAQQQIMLIHEIGQMEKLLEKVKKTGKDLSKPAKNLSVFYETFLVNKGSTVGYVKDVLTAINHGVSEGAHAIETFLNFV